MPHASSPEPLERLGVAGVCALLGLVIGGSACIVLAALHRTFSVPVVLLGVVGWFALIGFAAPRAAMNGAEAALHFAIGLSASRRGWQPDAGAPTWLRIALGAGLICGVALFAWFSSW